MNSYRSEPKHFGAAFMVGFVAARRESGVPTCVFHIIK